MVCCQLRKIEIAVRNSGCEPLVKVVQIVLHVSAARHGAAPQYLCLAPPSQTAARPGSQTLGQTDSKSVHSEPAGTVRTDDPAKSLWALS